MRRRMPGFLPALLWVLLAVVSVDAGAQDREDLLFRWDVRLWGGDVALGYRGWSLFPGVDTTFWISVGGGYQSLNHFPSDDDAAAEEGTSFKVAAADWRLGLSQGLIPHPTEDRSLLEAVLLYRGKLNGYVNNEDLDPSLADRDGLLQNSLLLALVLNGVTFDRRLITQDGVYASLSAEWVPRFFYNNVIGNSQYTRLSGLLSGFRTLHSTDAVSVTLAGRLLYDHLLGEDGSIPISALAAFGGLTKVPISSNPFRGLGGAVRGIQNERYDGRIKLANNLDLRVHFPAWRIFDLFVPGLVAYADAGVHAPGAGRLSFDPVYASVGAGVLLNGFTFDFIGYVDYFINENAFSFSLGLGAHF